jgi:flagellar biosynthesis/type III secretory pathway chaperone
MIASPDNLLDILRQEKKVFSELLQLSNIEQGYIVQNDIDGLMDVTSKKERLAVAVQELELKRQAYINSLGGNSSQGSFRAHMSTDGLDPLLEKEADELKNELLSVITEFDYVNQTNGELLKRSLDYVNFMLGAIIPDENPMYTNDSSPSSINLHLIDGKA